MTGWRHSLPRKIVLIAFPLALAIPALFWMHRPLAPVGVPTMAELRAEADRGGYRLVDLGELRERLEREPGRLLLVDTRQDWEHRAGHIPDSVNFSFEPSFWSRLKNRWALRDVLGTDRTRPLIFY